MTAPASTRQPLTTAERQRRYRQARDHAGLVELRNVWVHPDDRERVIQLVQQLAQARQAPPG